MKAYILVLFAFFAMPSLFAQESVTIKEPAEQCYQDLKTNLPQAVRWDDKQMMVTSRPLLTTLEGNVQVVTRVFPEKNDTQCKLVVAFDAPTQSPAWNAQNSSALWREAHSLGAKIESTMKAREKKSKK